MDIGVYGESGQLVPYPAVGATKPEKEYAMTQLQITAVMNARPMVRSMRCPKHVIQIPAQVIK